MRIVIAPDSFKDCMRSPRVCEVMAAGFRDGFPDARIDAVPMADGGEGTVEAVLAATGGERVAVTVTGPLGKPVAASFGLLSGGTAVIEMASASGLELVPEDARNPLAATTFGTGELLVKALDRGAREVILGIGGSATVDGGIGLGRALGFRFLDGSGAELPPVGASLGRIRHIDASQADSRLRDCRVRIASDVTNPLLGPAGAARVFGPQKGATPADVQVLESGLANLAKVWIDAGFLADTDRAGDGAAGGLGAGLRAFAGAESVSGARLIARIAGLRERIEAADAVVTGEGCTDEQTGHGKLCAVVGEIAREAGKPAILLSGTVRGDPDSWSPLFVAWFAACREAAPLARVLADGPDNLYLAARNVARLLAAGTGAS